LRINIKIAVFNQYNYYRSLKYWFILFKKIDEIIY